MNNISYEPRTLLDVLADIRKARLYIFGGLFLAFFLAFGFLALAPPHYCAQMLVGPASPLSAGQPVADSTDNNFSHAENTADFLRFENMVTGSHVAGLILKDENIVKGLFAEKALDQRWSPARLADYLKRRVRIEPVGDTKLRRLVYYHPDAEFAVYFLQRLQAATDGLIRAKARAEIAQRMDYLNKTMRQSSEPEQRRNLTTLLMEQERLLMMVSLDQPYAADIIEPASASYKPKWPEPVLVFAGFLLAGALAGFIVYGLRRA